MSNTKQPTFANLKIKPDIALKEIKWNDITIKVRQYATAAEKSELIAATLQKSQINNKLYDPILLVAYTALHIVYIYTNITFTEKQQLDELKLYDSLYSTGLLSDIVEAIPKEEIETIQNCLEIRRVEILKTNDSIGGAIRALVEDLPVNLEETRKVLQNFDFSQVKDLVDFTQAANGGNPVLEKGQN